MTTFDEYRALPALNFSSLKQMAVSPLAYRDALLHPRPDSAAMQLGRAVHCAVLEPDEFPRRYMLYPSSFLAREDLNRATKAGKEFEADWLSADPSRVRVADAAAWKRAVFSTEFPGVEVLDVTDYQTALAIRDAVRSHGPAIARLTDGAAEQVLQWVDESTGRACKARCDWISASAIVDLKTTAWLTPGRWSTEVARRQYHVQLAWYLDGARAAGHTAHEGVLVGVESAPPYDVGVWSLDSDALGLGRETYRAWLDRLATCERTGNWPGCYPQEETLGLPRWAYGPDEGDEFEVVSDERRDAQ